MGGPLGPVWDVRNLGRGECPGVLLIIPQFLTRFKAFRISPLFRAKKC